MGGVAGVTLAGGVVGRSMRSFQCSCLRKIVAGGAIGRSPGGPRVVSALPAAPPRRLSNFSARRLLWSSLEAEACCEPACARLSVSDRLGLQKSVFGVPRLGRVALPPEIVYRHSGASRSRAPRLRERAVSGSPLKLHAQDTWSITLVRPRVKGECCSAAACQIVLLSSSSAAADERFELGQVSCACLRRLFCLRRCWCTVTAWCRDYGSCMVDSRECYVGATTKVCMLLSRLQAIHCECIVRSFYRI
jgi:hypothetical protein